MSFYVQVPPKRCRLVTLTTNYQTTEEKYIKEEEERRRSRNGRGEATFNGGDLWITLHVSRNRRPSTSGIKTAYRGFLSEAQFERTVSPRRIQWRRYVKIRLSLFKEIEMRIYKIWNLIFFLKRENDDTEDIGRETHGGAAHG